MIFYPRTLESFKRIYGEKETRNITGPRPDGQAKYQFKQQDRSVCRIDTVIACLNRVFC